jgi:hypothetical protein
MHKNHFHSILAFIASLMFAALACNFGATPANAISTQAPPTAFPADTPSQIFIPSPTSTPQPVVENTPAPTLEIPATQADSQIMIDVKDYYEKGYLPYENGELTSLPDFSTTQPAMEFHDFTRTRVQAQDFALWADIELNSIGSTTYPNYTGCGFAYRVQNHNQGYTAILTNDYVRMGACSAGMLQCELFGTLHGTGEVDVQNKTKTRFSLIVNKDRAYVLVDGILAGQYNLFTSKLMGMGDLYYDAVSNYAAGYWTSCQMTNIQLWESYP